MKSEKLIMNNINCKRVGAKWYATQQGITLIALIITIIILLILAGVTISVLIGENGLFNTAKNAGESYQKAEIKELIQADIVTKQAEKGGKISERSLEKILKKYGELSSEEENLLDKTLTTNEGNYKIKVSDIFNGNIEKYQIEENNGLIGKISRIQNSGYSVISVSGKIADNTEETVSYNIHTIVHNGDLVLDGVMEVDGATLNSNTYEFGNKTTDVATKTEYAKNMVVLKVNGNLTINKNVILTACKSDNGYGGPKGMLIYCTGKLTNNGTISMTARGAKAEGQDVFLWQNDDESYEYVPKVGASGGASVTGYSSSASRVGNVSGKNGSDRKTGGGGSGFAMAWYGTTLTTPRGGNGTSYSGGSGAGGYMRHHASYTQPDLNVMKGSDVGGEGRKIVCILGYVL